MRTVEELEKMYTTEVYKQLAAAPKGEKQKVLLNAGWTEEEIKLFPKMDRTEMVDGSSKNWPKINGVTTYPFTWMLTESEKQIYYGWKKAYDSEHTGNGPKAPKVKAADKETLEMVASIKEIVAKSKVENKDALLALLDKTWVSPEALERQKKEAMLAKLKEQQAKLEKELGL